MFGRRRGPRPGSIYSFLATWLFLSLFFPMYRLGSLLLTLGAGLAVAYLVGRAAGRRSSQREAGVKEKAPRQTVDTTVRKVGEPAVAKAAPQAQEQPKPAEKKSYGNGCSTRGREPPFAMRPTKATSADGTKSLSPVRKVPRTKTLSATPSQRSQ